MDFSDIMISRFPFLKHMTVLSQVQEDFSCSFLPLNTSLSLLPTSSTALRALDGMQQHSDTLSHTTRLHDKLLWSRNT